MTSTLAWVGFILFLLVMLAVDLFIFHRRPHAVTLRESLRWAGVWVGLALLFNLGILYFRGPKPALEFLTGYLIEESLSIDNLFVFLLIFSYFRVPERYQHKVLFWGILGAIVMRLVFIVAGVALIHRFHWVIYVFGAILVISGIKMWSHQTTEIHPERNLVLRLFRRVYPVSATFEDGKFFVRIHGRRVATTLFVVLLLVETTDLLFALDSIPAVLAITHDPFIVFSSNAFAVMGLRTIYFALADLMKVFHYLHYGLSAILVFVGLKMLLADVFEIPIPVALAIIGTVLVGCVVLSQLRPRPVPPPLVGPGADVEP
jgi:tellurite resistance protein TerC